METRELITRFIDTAYPEGETDRGYAVLIIVQFADWLEKNNYKIKNANTRGGN